MGKRGRSVATAAAHTHAASPRSPPPKKRAVGLGGARRDTSNPCRGSDGEVTLHCPPSIHLAQLSSTIPSVSASSVESVESALPLQAEEEEGVRGGQGLDGQRPSKRSRSDAKVDSSRDGAQRRHRRDGGGASFSASSSTRIDRTLQYDTAEAVVSPSSPLPSRRPGFLLTSTPAFLRQREQPADTPHDRSRRGSNSAYGARPSTAVVTTVSSPVRLVRAAQSFLSPARSTLLWGFSHLRQSVTRSPPPQQQQQQQQHQSQEFSPFGRLSSIQPLRDHLPSLSAHPWRDGEGSGSCGDDGVAAAAAAAAGRGRGGGLAPPLLNFGVSSVPNSRRSSISASGAWRHQDTAEGSASGSVASLSSGRTSFSPPAQGVEENTQAWCHPRRHWEHRHRDPRGFVELQGGGVAAAAAAVALAGPSDARFASVSTLSGSLASVVASSRSTAHSSLASSSLGAAGGEPGDDDRHHRAGRTRGGSPGGVEAALLLPRRSTTTLTDPDLSSILPDEEERARRRRMLRHGQRDHPPTQRTLQPLSGPRTVQRVPPNVLELPAARPPASRAVGGASRVPVGANPGAPRGSDGGSSGADTHRDAHPPRVFRSTSTTTPVWQRVSRATRGSVLLGVAMVLLWCVAAAAWPLVALQAAGASHGWDEAFVDAYVNPVSDLQALYQVPPASLSADAVARLHRRTLSEGVERLERATQHLTPHDATPPPHRLRYLRAMIQAYRAVQRNSELYARSRDASLPRRLLGDALADVWTYGLHRFDSFSLATSSLSSSSGLRGWTGEWRDRLVTSVACSVQSEFVACPSLRYVEDAMARAAAPFVVTDVNAAFAPPERRLHRREWQMRLHRDWASEVYLETLLSYLRSSVQELTRDYNP